MGFSQAIAVNSEFTKRVVEKTWPGLTSRVSTKVVYPCVDTGSRDSSSSEVSDLPRELVGQKIILSINRFERKKDVGLALKAFAALPESARKDARLIIAGKKLSWSPRLQDLITDQSAIGGYDSRIAENVEYHVELEQLADSLNLTHHTIKNFTSPPPPVPVLFLQSVPNTLKAALLKAARLLVYTPSNEHFGIVPLEAMLSRTPVLAANTGGPVETVLDGETGWLRRPDDVPGWTAVVGRALALDDRHVEAMGKRGEDRVKSMFGRDKMADRLEDLVDEIVELKRPPPLINAFLNFFGIVLVFALGLGTSRIFARLHGKA